jgi:hypothetical protein
VVQEVSIGLPHQGAIHNYGLNARCVGNKTVGAARKVKDPANLATTDCPRIKHHKVRGHAQGNQAAI